MLPSGRKLSCVRGGIHGSGEVRRSAEPSGEGAAPADDQGWDEFRTKRRYAEEGLDEVLRHHNQANRRRKVDERVPPLWYMMSLPLTI